MLIFLWYAVLFFISFSLSINGVFEDKDKLKSLKDGNGKPLKIIYPFVGIPIFLWNIYYGAIGKEVYDKFNRYLRYIFNSEDFIGAMDGELEKILIKYIAKNDKSVKMRKRILSTIFSLWAVYFFILASSLSIVLIADANIINQSAASQANSLSSKITTPNDIYNFLTGKKNGFYYHWYASLAVTLLAVVYFFISLRRKTVKVTFDSVKLWMNLMDELKSEESGANSSAPDETETGSASTSNEGEAALIKPGEIKLKSRSDETRPASTSDSKPASE